MSKSKLCYLVTSQEKSPPKDGDGFSNTDSRTLTGKRIAAILQAQTVSSSHTVSLHDYHKAGLSLWVTQNGPHGVSADGLDQLVKTYLKRLSSLKTW